MEESPRATVNSSNFFSTVIVMSESELSTRNQPDLWICGQAQEITLRALTTRSRLKILVHELDGVYCLMVQSLAGVNPAGWRLQRGGYFPIEQFKFFDEDDAKLAAFKLQKYVDEN